MWGKNQIKLTLTITYHFDVEVQTFGLEIDFVDVIDVNVRRESVILFGLFAHEEVEHGNSGFAWNGQILKSLACWPY